MWPFGRNEKKEPRVVALRGNAERGALVALAVRPTFALPEPGEDTKGPPSEMCLLVPGMNRTQKGDFLFDELAAANVMAFWAENKVDLTFDYEHQALAEPPMEAPCACYRWVPEFREGALWATSMQWTDKATGYITAKEYRYWSPALLFDAETSRVNAILNCALTNLPATKGIAPLVAASVVALDAAASESTKETAMDPKDKEIADLKAQLSALTANHATLSADHATLTAKLSAFEDSDKANCTVLGVSLTAPKADRFAATNALVTLRGSLFEATGKTDVPSALGTINAWKSEAGEVVALKAEMVTLKADHAKRADTEAAAEFDAVIESGIASGKLPKSEDHEIRKSLKTAVLRMGGDKPTKDGIAWLRADIAARSQFVTTVPTPGNDGGGTGVVALSATDKDLIKRHGLDPKAAEEAKRQIAEQQAAFAVGRSARV